MVFLFSLFALVGCGEVVEGPQGPAGAKGANGKSAYEIAVENGFNGTEEAWLESLHGEDGEPGLNGLQGPQGEPGPAGEPAKEIELFAEDGGVYWRLKGEEKAELLYYYLDYVTVSYKYPAQYSSLEEIKAGFLADINSYRGDDPIEADEFYAKYSEKFMNVTAVDAGEYSINGFLVDHIEFFAKWKWLFNFIGKVQGDKKYGNTALYAFGLDCPNPDNLVTSSLNYADRTMTNSIDNFLNGTDDVLHGGSSSGAVPADFTTPEAYEGIIDAYYAGILSIKDVHVPRDEYKSYQFLTDETEPLVAAAFDGEKFFYDGWTNAKGEVIENIPSNHSLNVYLKLAKKTAVNLEFDGGFSATDLKDAVQAAFLADINAVEGFEDVTAENFYTKFATKFMNVTAVDAGVYTTDGFCKDHPEFLAKWTWFIEYIGKVMGDKKYGNTALVAFGLHSAKDSNVVTSSLDYADKTVTNSISNFFNGVATNLHGGGSSGNVPADFSKDSAYSGLAAAVPAEELATLPLPEGKNNVIVALGLPSLSKDGLPLVGWYLKGDETKANVAPEAMEDGQTYVAKYLEADKAAAADALLAAFLADVSTALEKNYTADGLYSAFRSGVSDFTEADVDKFFMGVIDQDGTLVKFGVMVGHEDVIAKHAFIFEYISQLLMDEKWIGASKHKYEQTVMSLFGIQVAEGARVVSAGSESNKYFNRCMVVQLVNLINHTYVETGEEGYDAIDFTDPNLWCYGLLEYKAAYDAAHAE